MYCEETSPSIASKIINVITPGKKIKLVTNFIIIVFMYCEETSPSITSKIISVIFIKIRTKYNH